MIIISKEKKISIILYFFFGLFFISRLNHVNNPIHFNNYILNLTSYFFMTGIFLIIFLRYDTDLFDPITFFSLIYITMFSITPLTDIITNNTLFFGIDLFKYGIKGTTISMIGYLFFSIGYISVNKKKYISENQKYKKQTYVFIYDKIIFLSLIIWLFCFIASISHLYLSKGQNLFYILTLGLTGNVNNENINSISIGFLSMISYSMVPTYLVYFNYGKSKSLKFILFYLTIIIFLIRGFRFIIIIFLLAIFYLYYLCKKRKPSIINLIIVVFLLIVLIGAIGFYRDNIRIGDSVNWSNFSLEHIIQSILGNFRIYNSYYSVIKSVPSKLDYNYGQQMLKYTFIYFIPRFIWPDKPLPKVNEPIRLGISEYASKAGAAYPNIGEFYYEFGVLGVIIFMYLFGFLLKKIKIKYRDNFENEWDLIIYSIFVPTILQLTIRGYTPSNFYLVWFLIGPVFLIKHISKTR